jgi:hypothetical protein
MKAYLKPLGATGWRIEPEWTVHNADILTGADYPFEPRSIGPGTLLVLYATGHQVIFGISEVTSRPYPANRHPRWPWRCDHRVRLAVPQLHDAPHLSTLNVAGRRDLLRSVRQRPFVELSRDEYGNALDALVRPLRRTDV